MTTSSTLTATSSSCARLPACMSGGDEELERDCPFCRRVLRPRRATYQRVLYTRPLLSRWAHPGQQQGRRWPSSNSSWVRRMRRSRVVSCLAASTQQMNSLRASGVMSVQASSAVGLAASALRRSAGSLCTTPPGSRALPMRRRYPNDRGRSASRAVVTPGGRGVCQGPTGRDSRRPSSTAWVRATTSWRNSG